MQTENTLIKEKTAARQGPGLYRKFVSIKTSLIFFAIFAVIFFIGTVFPQSTDPDRLEQYREAGGKLVALVGWLRLLNIFHSWYFLLLAILFSIHLLLCCIDRLTIIGRRPKYGLFSREELLRREHSFSVSCANGDTGPDIESALKMLGFGRVRYYSENAQVKRMVAEKGLPYRWLSWAYHVSALLAVVGFTLSALFAYEGYVVLSKGERQAIPSSPPETTWNTLSGALDLDWKTEPEHLEIELKNFSTVYTEKPTLNYPDKISERFLSVWWNPKTRPRYRLPKDALAVQDWFSTLKLYRNGHLVKEKTVEVNDPLRFDATTFYQAGYEYSFNLSAGDEQLTGLEVQRPFSIPQMEGQFLLEAPRGGPVKGYDGAIKEVPIAATLKYHPPASSEKRAWQTVAQLVPGRPVDVMRTRMVLSDVKESSVLSYRHDPGVPILWLAFSSLLILMCLRIYLPWYQVHFYAEKMDARSQVTVSIRMIGLFARPERLKMRMSNALRM
jgi:cytochrome c biogenesis protein ResB